MDWLQFSTNFGIGLASALTVIGSFRKETRNGDNRNLPTRIDDFVDEFKDFRQEMRSDLQEMRSDIRGVHEEVRALGDRVTVLEARFHTQA